MPAWGRQVGRTRLADTLLEDSAGSSRCHVYHVAVFVIPSPSCLDRGGLAGDPVSGRVPVVPFPLGQGSPVFHQCRASPVRPPQSRGPASFAAPSAPLLGAPPVPVPVQRRRRRSASPAVTAASDWDRSTGRNGSRRLLRGSQVKEHAQAPRPQLLWLRTSHLFVSFTRCVT